MLLSKIKLVFTVLLAVGVISGSIGLLTVNSNAESAGQGFILGSEKQGAASVADRERLQGSWRTIEAKRGGAKRPEMIVLKLTFEGKKVQLSMGAEKKQGSFRLYPDKSPKRIDLFVDGEKGMGIGIYKFQGDKLYLCVDDYNNSRPNSFTSAAGSEHAFLILQRTAGGAAKLDQAEVDALRKENEQLRKQLAVTQDELLKMKAFLQQIKAREQQKQAQLQELLKLQKLNEIRLKQAEEQAKKEFEKAQKALQLEKLLQQLETEKKLQALQQAKTAQQKAAAAAQAPKATRASVKNLRSIGVAMHNYHDVHKRLPASTIYSDSGKPLLSWRVAILPYLNQTQLYKQFKLNEPWNSPHNLKLLEQMPKIYAPVAGQGHEKNETYYQVFTGPKTLFDGSTGKRFIDVRDGTSNTVMVVEAGTAVPWTKPADLNYSPGKPLPKLGGLFDGMNILLADGSTTFVPAEFNEAMFRRLITIGDGHPLDLEQLRSPETTSKEQ